MENHSVTLDVVDSLRVGRPYPKLIDLGPAEYYEEDIAGINSRNDYDNFINEQLRSINDDFLKYTRERLYRYDVNERMRPIYYIDLFNKAIPPLGERFEQIQRADAEKRAAEFAKEQAEKQARLERKQAERQAQIERERSGNLDDLLATDFESADDWVIPGVLRPREVVGFTGNPGTGKSTALAQIGYQCAHGIHPVTLRPMEPRRVLIIDLQNPKEQVKSNLDRMPVYQPGVPLRIEFWRNFYVEEERSQERFLRLIDEYEPELVIIGPVAKMARTEMSSATHSENAAAALFSLLSEVMDDVPFAVLLEMHAGKDKRNHQPRGSQRWSDECTYGVHLSKTGESSQWREPRSASRPWPTMTRKHTESHKWPWHLTAPVLPTDTVKDDIRQFKLDNPQATYKEIQEKFNVSAGTVRNALKGHS